jgi:hypothetical protein
MLQFGCRWRCRNFSRSFSSTKTTIVDQNPPSSRTTSWSTKRWTTKGAAWQSHYDCSTEESDKWSVRNRLKWRKPNLEQHNRHNWYIETIRNRQSKQLTSIYQFRVWLRRNLSILSSIQKVNALISLFNNHTEYTSCTINDSSMSDEVKQISNAKY